MALRKPLELREGDKVDLTVAISQGRINVSEHTALIAESEYAVVDCVKQETDDCVLVHFRNFPSIGFPIDKPLIAIRPKR